MSKSVKEEKDFIKDLEKEIREKKKEKTKEEGEKMKRKEQIKDLEEKLSQLKIAEEQNEIRLKKAERTLAYKQDTHKKIVLAGELIRVLKTVDPSISSADINFDLFSKYCENYKGAMINVFVRK